MEAKRDQPLAFPHHIGPGTRNLTTALLYHRGLEVSLPGWIVETPIEAFNIVFAHAVAASHPLRPVFGSVAHFFELAQVQGIEAMEALRPLGGRITKVLTVYPGTTDAYASWEPIHNSCLPVAADALSDPITSCTASVEFVWRVWEAALELGADPDDVKTVNASAVLALLDERAKRLGDPKLLLAECVLNRYCMPRSGAGSYATASASAVELLASIGTTLKRDIDDVDTTTIRREALAFYLYDRVVEPFVSSMTPPAIPVLAALIDENEEALVRMRTHCENEAAALIASSPNPQSMRAALAKSLGRMTEEAQAIAKVDRSTVRTYFETLSESYVAWTTIAGLIGSAVSLPAVVTASLAITGFSLMGANAVKASRERREALQASPWMPLYHAQSAFGRPM